MNKLNEEMPMIELPRYKSHKIVHALKIHAIDLDLPSGAAVITPAEPEYGPFAVDAEYMGKHKPRIGGYYVVYDDGYKSWSPVDAFEKGYVKVDGTHSPLSELKAALQANDDFAWTWLCNLACIGLDSGGTHENSNRRAAQFMKNAFDVDVTTQKNWKDFEAQWLNEAVVSVVTEVVSSGMAFVRSKRLMDQIMKTWDPPLLTGNERPADIAQTATMVAIAYIMGREFLPDELTVNQRAAIDSGLTVFKKVLEVEEEKDPTIVEWMEDYEAAVESGQSRISREEAEKRYYQKFGRNRQQNDDY